MIWRWMAGSLSQWEMQSVSGVHVVYTQIPQDFQILIFSTWYGFYVSTSHLPIVQLLQSYGPGQKGRELATWKQLCGFGIFTMLPCLSDCLSRFSPMEVWTKQLSWPMQRAKSEGKALQRVLDAKTCRPTFLLLQDISRVGFPMFPILRASAHICTYLHIPKQRPWYSSLLGVDSGKASEYRRTVWIVVADSSGSYQWQHASEILSGAGDESLWCFIVFPFPGFNAYLLSSMRFSASRATNQPNGVLYISRAEG